MITNQVFSQQAKRFQVDGCPSLNFALFDGQHLWGFGGHLKLQWSGRKNEDAFVFGIDFDMLKRKSKYGTEIYTDIYAFTVASIGYRKRINSFFIEPQLGGGVYREDYNIGCFTIGLESGIQRDRFSFSAGYRLSADEVVFGDHFNMFFAKIGYRII